MSDLSAYKYNQLIRVPSNESLLSNSTTVSEDSGHNENQSIEHYENGVPSDYSEPITVSNSLTFDKLEVKDSRDVHIGNKYHCASVNVYEAGPCKYFKS